MALPDEYTLRFTPSDKFDITIDVLDDAGAVVNLTGETITLKIYSQQTLLLTLSSGSGLTISASIGRIVVALTSAQTESLRAKNDVRYVLRLDSPSERTVLIGRIEVRPNV